MALPNKDQLKFHSYQDAKLLMEAIEKRYGGNKESKKVQRTLLEQQYENFAALSSESMDQTFDMLQKLISQLEIQGEVINQEHMNLKLTNNTNINNTTDDIAHGVSTTHSTTHTQGNEDLEQLHPDDLEEMDLQWEMVMLTIRARRFIKRTGKKLDINGQRVGFDKSKVECFNYHKHGHFTRECRFPKNQEYKGRENNTRTIAVESPTQNALIAQDGIGGYNWSYQAKEEQPTNHALMAFTSLGSSSSSYSESLNNILESQVIDKSKIGLGYNAATAASPAVESFVNLTDKSGSDKGYHSVPPPLTGDFIPHKPDLTFMDEIVKSENLDVTTVVTPCNDKTVENKGVSNIFESNAVRMNNTSAPIIEDWNSDDESEIDYTVSPSTEKIKSIKTVRETDAPKQNKHNPRGDQRNWNNLMSQRLGSDFKMTNKAYYDCGSFEHLHYVCDKKVERPMSGKLSTAGVAVNTVRPVNTANTKAVNTLRPVNTANTKVVNTVRSVNTAASKPIMNHPRTKTNAFKRGYSQSSRPFNRHFANKNNIINTNVNPAKVKHTTVKDRAVVSKNKRKWANIVKASACWVWKAKNSSASTTFKKYSYVDAQGKSKSIMAWVPKRI
ncbi:ribonuclease H-like domain-containing protein [Tanacetum coccineum]